ncbi:hypothetical protein ABZ468_35250 [Streptomyces sp. NPDC005708]|uniref:hypothetical protein n=1 Tax=Streptomyces sp. NPDC005708 TaxID=3154564 RepID=UPI0033C8C980
MQYYQVLISAEQWAQASRILDALMAKQLVLGGPSFSGPAKFLWNFQDSSVPGELRENKLLTDEHDYRFIVTYTREDLKQELIEVAEEASLEEVCMISFMPIEVNAALAKLLESTFAGRETASAPPTAIDAVAALTFVSEGDIPNRTAAYRERTSR